MNRLLSVLLVALSLCCAGSGDAVRAQAVPGQGMAVPSAQPQVPAGSSQALTTASGFFNVNATDLATIRKSFANVRAGTGRGRILTLTDSTGMGAGSGSGGTNNLNGAYPKGWVPNLATLLSGTISTSFQSMVGNQSSSVAYGTYDTRVTLGANWGSGTVSLAGNSFRFTVGAVNDLTFAPTPAFDTVTAIYITFPGDGSAAINVDNGSSLGTLNGNAASGLVTQTFTVSKTTHTIHVVPTNNGQFELVSLITYDSTTPAIDIIQAGAFGAKAASFDLTASPWSALNVVKALAPTLTIISLTINDSNASTDLATYTSQLQDIITAVKLSGDCILMPGPPSNTTQATNGTLTQFVAVNRALAASNDCAMVDITTRWVSYAVTNPLMPYFDTLHPEAQGYWDIGLAIYQAISMTNAM